MLPTKLIFLAILPLCLMVNVGCGGSVAPGVAEGPDEPEPEMTSEEEATELESARDAASLE